MDALQLFKHLLLGQIDYNQHRTHNAIIADSALLAQS